MSEPKHKIIFTEDAIPPLPPFCSWLHFCRVRVYIWSNHVYVFFHSSSISAQATVLNGLVYCSGNIGCDREWKLVGDVREQTVRYSSLKTFIKYWSSWTLYLQRAALENLSKVLLASGSSLRHIVKANIYYGFRAWPAILTICDFWFSQGNVYVKGGRGGDTWGCATKSDG